MNLILLFLPLMAFADSPKVILFGGNHAVASDMKRCYPGFENYGYAEGESKVEGVVREIDSHPDQQYIVAAHSSGASWGERVAAKVKRPSQIKLVLLEGIGSNQVQKRVKTTCWYAKNGKKEGLNAGPMRADCADARPYEDHHCKTQWCLHFTLVNVNAPEDLNGGTFPAHGYDNCRGNTVWLSP